MRYRVATLDDQTLFESDEQPDVFPQKGWQLLFDYVPPGIKGGGVTKTRFVVADIIQRYYIAGCKLVGNVEVYVRPYNDLDHGRSNPSGIDT